MQFSTLSRLSVVVHTLIEMMSDKILVSILFVNWRGLLCASYILLDRLLLSARTSTVIECSIPLFLQADTVVFGIDVATRGTRAALSVCSGTWIWRLRLLRRSPTMRGT